MKMIQFLRLSLVLWIVLPCCLRAEFEIYFMRHGETPWNRSKTLQGSIDTTDLTEVGIGMAQESADTFVRKGIAFDRIYTSPQRRARHTAEIVAFAQGLSPRPDARLRERFCGSCEGMRYENPEKLAEMLAKASDAESVEAVAARTMDFFEKELAPLDGQVRRVLCVSHSLLLKVLEARLAGDGTLGKSLLPNCCAHVIVFRDGRFELKARGSTFYDPAHFSGGQVAKTGKEIPLEGGYGGHLQDFRMSSNAVWWAHTDTLVKTDRAGRILKRAHVGGHHAGLEIRDGRLYTAVCAFNGEPRGATTANCHVMVGEYDAETLERIEMRIYDINDRAGSFCFLEDGTYLVGCLRHPALKPNEVKFHHIGRDHRLIATHVVDVGKAVPMGIEVIRRYGDDLFLFVYGAPALRLDARTFAVKERIEGLNGTVGFVREGPEAWFGKTWKGDDKQWHSRIVLRPDRSR